MTSWAVALALVAGFEHLRASEHWSWPYVSDALETYLVIRPTAVDRRNDPKSILPPMDQRTNGNAADDFREVVRIAPAWPTNQEESYVKGTRWGEWSSARPDQLLRDSIERELTPYRPAIAHARRAAFQTQCDWNDPDADLSDEFLQRRDYVFNLRKVVDAARYVGKLDLMAQRFDSGHVQFIFGIGKHHQIRGYVEDRYAAIGYSHIGIQAIHDWQSVPGSPSWVTALANRPRPFDDCQSFFESDRRRFDHHQRRLLDVPAGVTSIADVETLFQELNTRALGWGEGPPESIMTMIDASHRDPRMEWFMDLHTWDRFMSAIEDYQAAIVDLTQRGMNPAILRRMPPRQAVMLSAAYRLSAEAKERDAILRKPWPVAMREMQAREKRFRENHPAGRRDWYVRAYRMTNELMPRVMLERTLRIERRLDLTQAVEAIRLHRTMTGQWPDRLADIRVATVPVDPMTGKMFTYKRFADRIELMAESYSNEPNNKSNAERYVVRWKGD